MFLRLVADSFGRRPRHKLLTGAALALGMAVATAALSVALDVGDRLAQSARTGVRPQLGGDMENPGLQRTPVATVVVRRGLLLRQQRERNTV